MLKIGEFVVDSTGKTWVIDQIETDADGETFFFGSDDDGKEQEIVTECLIATAGIVEETPKRKCVSCQKPFIPHDTAWKKCVVCAWI